MVKEDKGCPSPEGSGPQRSAPPAQLPCPWQPIETAPDSIERLLLGWFCGEEFVVVIGRKDSISDVYFTSWDIEPIDPKYWAPFPEKPRSEPASEDPKAKPEGTS